MTLCKKYLLTPITTNLQWQKTREKDVKVHISLWLSTIDLLINKVCMYV